MYWLIEAGITQVPLLLHLFWGLSAGAAVVALLPGKWAPRFKQAVYLSACRGKLWDNKPSTKLGWLTDQNVPQSWFAHFYMVGVLSNTLTLVACILLPSCRATLLPTADTPQWGLPCLALLLLQVHLVRRLAETVLIMKYPSGARMHLVAYLFGLIYYIVLPLSCLPESVFWDHGKCIGWTWDMAGSALRQMLTHGLRQALRPYAWRAVLGAAVFLAGNWLQNSSHRILASLAPSKLHRASSGSTKHTNDADYYKLPTGGGFDYVSCPHYLGEIVIYAGLLVLLGPLRLLPWLIMTWVVANLLLAAAPTHRWYRRIFKHYPVKRKAIVPFLY